MIRKYYPYLQDSYRETEQGAKEKLNFLNSVDNFINQKQYVRITLLNWNEEPLKEIQGELNSGTISKDGSSSVRRTCQLSAIVNRGEYDVEDGQMDFAINKKIFIECGVKNYSKYYLEYPILWFPQGVFFISSFNISTSAMSTINISLTLKDKMCGLNGEVGGKFPATTILDEVDTQTPSGEYISQKILIYDIIKEMVNHYGGESLNNIVIEDVPLRIKRVMKWTGENPLYLKAQGNADSRWYEALTEKPDDMTGVKAYPTNEDVGYTYADFVYDAELTANAGQAVTDVLDTIKNYLGNFEYFYDEYGVFHFREIKNYLNTTQATDLLNDMSENKYLADITTGKTSYVFSDKTNLISLTQTPQYENIKNDFIVQGKRKGTSSNAEVDIRYHVAIDRKPIVGNTYQDLLLYKEPETELVKAAFPLGIDSEKDLPLPGNFNIIYRTNDTNIFYYWEDNLYKEVNIVKYYPIAANEKEGYTTKDWRTELYLQGLLAKNNGTDAGQYYTKLQQTMGQAASKRPYLDNIYRQATTARIDTDYYFEELDAFWPQIYNLETQKFYGQEEDTSLYSYSLTDGNYFLDFIEPSSSALGEFAIANIGRRTNVTINDDINCLFQPEIPNIIFLNADADDIETLRNEAIQNGQPWTQVKENIFNALATGGHRNGAFDQVKYDINIHTNYQKTLSATSIPAFYLEPNTRVQVQDATTNLNGDFNIKTISIPFGAGNVMATTMNQSVERL